MSTALHSCFRGAADPPSSLPSSSISSHLTTCLYRTPLGVVSLTWCRFVLGRALRVDLHRRGASVSFCLRLRPWLFWKKRGSKKLLLDASGGAALISWDLSSAAFGPSGAEPTSSFYVAIAVDGMMALVVGDAVGEAYARMRAHEPAAGDPLPSLIMRREHVLMTGSRTYASRAAIGGRARDISIDFASGGGGEPRLAFSVDGGKVLQVKHLRWKFRGNETIDLEGIPIQVSWDVRDWLFDGDADATAVHAVLLFRFEEGEWWQPPFGLEEKKLKKSLLKTKSSSSSSSSVSSRGSSVMEWSSVEENVLQSSPGISLLIYAWKR